MRETPEPEIAVVLSRRLEILLLLALAFHGSLLLNYDGRSQEWLLLGVTILFAVWALLQRGPNPWLPALRGLGTLSAGGALAFASGGANSLFTLWFYTLGALYPLLLTGSAAALMAAIVPLTYLGVGFFAPGSLPPGLVIAQAILLGLVGGGAYTFSLSFRSDRTGQAGRPSAALMDETEVEGQRARADRLASLNRLARGIAHELNNVFTALIGQLSLIAVQLDQDDPLHGYLVSARAATDRALELSRDLQLFAGRLELPLAPLALNDVVVHFAEELDARLPPDVNLELDLAPDLPRIQGNAQALIRLLDTSTARALQGLTDGPGIIEITTQQTPARGMPVGYLGQRFDGEELVTLTIVDNGPPIDSEVQTHFFEPFHTTTAREPGLAQARILGIVRAHRADIHLESHSTAGTTVTVLFPPEEPALIAPPEATPVRPSGAGETRYILLITPWEETRALLQEALGNMGFRVMHAAEPEEADRLAHAFAHNLYCVVLASTPKHIQYADVLRARRPELLMLAWPSAGESEQPPSQEELAGLVEAIRRGN